MTRDLLKLLRRRSSLQGRTIQRPRLRLALEPLEDRVTPAATSVRLAVIGDYGTAPNTSLYEELKGLSRNLGEVDLDELAAGRPQTIDRNPAGAFFLYRIGDAWAGRNIHAAMLDAMRVCKDL